MLQPDWALIAEIAGTVAAVMTIIVAIPKARQVVTPVAKRVLQAINPLHSTFVAMERIEGKLDAMGKELRPNGGGSIWDKIDAVWLHLGVNRAMLDQAFDHDPIPSWRSDVNGRHERANRAMLSILGRPQEDLIGDGWINVIHSDDRDRLIKEWSACLVQKRDFRIRCRVWDLKEHVYDVVLEAWPLRFEDRVVGWRGQATVVSKKERAQWTGISATASQ